MTSYRGPGRGALDAALAGARQIADHGEQSVLAEVERRLRAGRLTVLVAGEAKRGKSSMVNAILGRDVCPTGATPLTSVATRVTTAGGDLEGAEISLDDGTRRWTTLEEVGCYVTESGNPGNCRGVTEVAVRVAGTLLDELPVDLVDGPGTGSVYSETEVRARRALGGLDAAILVVSVDPPITAAERELLAAIDEHAVWTVVAVNKCDRATPAELDEVLGFTSATVSAVTGGETRLFRCAARDGSADPGVARLTADLVDHLSRHAVAEVETALSGHLRRALVSMRDRRRVQRRALIMARSGEAEALDLLRRRLATLSAQRAEISARLDGSIAAINRDLEREARSATVRLGRECLSVMTRELDGDLRGMPVRDLEVRGREVLQEVVSRVVENWRTHQARQVEAALAEVSERTSVDASAQVQLAREALARSLHVEVQVESVDIAMAALPGFRYDFTPPQGWDAPLVGAVAAVTPTPLRRARARSRLLTATREMTDRQVGRARFDLRRRIDVSAAQLGADLARALDATIGQFDEALRRAVGHSTDIPRTALSELAIEEDAIEELLASLPGQAPPPTRQR